MIVDFKARFFFRATIKAAKIREKVELQTRSGLEESAYGHEVFARDDDSCFTQRLNDFTDQLEFLIDWRDELAWRIAKAELQLVWMEKREFDALVNEVRSWRAACELMVWLAEASEPEAPFHD